MKLLIVLGLFPLFSAQQFGFGSFPSFSSSPPFGQGYKNKNNNNKNMRSAWNNNNNRNNKFGGFGNNRQKQGNNENLPGVDRINAELVRQLKSTTNSLTDMMKQVAENPQTRPVVDSMFNSMSSLCVSSMDDAIAAMQQGVGVAEAGLLGATNLLDTAIEGTSNFGEESLLAGLEAINAAGGSVQENRKSGSKTYRRY